MSERTSKLQITEREVEDVTVLTLAGQITLDDGDLVFGKYVDGLVAKGRIRILVDLAEVTYIDSAGVGMMAAELKMVQKKGGAMKLIRLSERSHRVLAMMKLMTVFETFDDEASGIKSFAWGARR